MAQCNPVLTFLLRYVFRQILSLLVLVVAGQTVLSQPEHLIKVNSGRGLSQGMVHCMIQDSKGFIWIGTKDGLNRYDGYDFRVFRHDPFDSLSLSDNRIQGILEDHVGRLWISTPVGLNLFDPRLEIFHELELSIDDVPQSIRDVRGMLEDNHRNIWVLTTQHILYRVTPPDAYDFSLIEVLRIDLQESAVHGDTIAKADVPLIQLTDSLLIVPTPKGLNTIRLYPGGNLFSISWDTTGFPSWLQEFFGTPGPKRISRSRQGHIWLCTGQEVVRLNQQGGRSAIFHPGEFPEWDANLVWTLAEDSQGNAVVATTPGLFYCSTTGNTEFQSYRSFGFPDYHFGALLYDRSDNLWLGTKGDGVFRSDIRTMRFGKSRTAEDQVLAWHGPSIRALLQLSTGEILVAPVADVAFVLNPDGTTSSIGGLTSVTLSFCETRDGTILAAGAELQEIIKDRIGGWRTASVYQIPRHHHPNGVKILQTKDSALWVLTIANLCRFDTNGDTFSCVDLPLTSGSLSYLPEFPTMTEDNSGLIWIGTSAGLLQYDPVRNVFREFQNDPANPGSLASNVVRSIAPDPVEPDRWLWLGLSGGGLDKFEIATGHCRHYHESHGLPDPVVYAILPDRERNLWISTNRGLAVMNPETEAIKTFDRGDGLVNDEFNAGASALTADGVMLFGGVGGFNRFAPELVNRMNQHIPSVALTTFKVSNKTVSVRSPGFSFPESITYTQSVRIPPWCKSFSIEYAAFDFTAPEKNQFRYLLEGFDLDWQYAGNARSATYTNLDPGKYTFRFTGSNNDGIWNADGSALDIVVLPPWYKTWWAYSLYVLAACGILFFVRKKELHEQKLKHQLMIEHMEAEKLKDVDRMKSQFFANISHEFRTPLALILGNLEIAGNQTTDATLRKRLGAAAGSGEKLLQLINQLLDLSKIDAGYMPLHRKQLDMIPFLKGILKSFEAHAEGRAMGLRLISEQDSVVFAFDPEKMERVLMNLLSNAFKFTPDGGDVNVTAKVSGFGDEVPTFVLTVTDTGTGIPRASLAHVFDRFYQSDHRHVLSHRTENQSVTANGGTGIGLALVRELVRLHDGDVNVESEAGNGASFVVRIPMLQVEDTAVATMHSVVMHEEEAMSSSVADGSMTAREVTGSDDVLHILIVEDNSEVRSLLQALLDSESYLVTEAGNGQEGLKLAEEIVPDLILTDVMMPVMDGFEFCRQIRADIRTSHIPVVMLTALVQEDDRIRGLEAGVDDYLTKPVSARELKLRIANLISQRQLLRERFSGSNRYLPVGTTAVPMDIKFIETAFDCIEENLGESTFGVEQLALLLHMSVKNLTRKLNALTGHPPGQLIRNARLQRAAAMLAGNEATVAEVAYDVGYTVPENFSRSFKKHFGVSPSDYARGVR